MSLQRSVCLVTNEMFPVTHGGCGTLVYNSIFEFLDAGYRVYLLADISLVRLKNLGRHVRHFPHLENLEILDVDSMLSKSDRSFTPSHAGLWQSWRFYCALRRLAREEEAFRPDIIEFPDYLGYAYFTLAAQKSVCMWPFSRVVVRFHLTIELINRHSAHVMPAESHVVTYGVERWCLRMADAVVVPSERMATMVTDFYGKALRLLVSRPSLRALRIRQRSIRDPHIVLFYSRLAPQKGAELFVIAALKVLERGDADARFKFCLAGPDTYQSPSGEGMHGYLKSLIPPVFADRFEFAGYVSHEELQRLLPDVACAVFPSRLESYCYAARELAAAGVPLVISDIPGLADLGETGAAAVSALDGRQLAEQIQKMISGESPPRYVPVEPGSVELFLKAYQSVPTPERVASPANEFRILVIILDWHDTGGTLLERTLQHIGGADGIKVVVASACIAGNLVLRGRRWRVNVDPDSPPDSVCFLAAGDVVPAGYFPWARRMLAENPGIGVVGGVLAENGMQDHEAVPWDAVPEMLPFEEPGTLRRCVMRCNGAVWAVCTDPFMAEMHESAAIWAINSAGLESVRSPEFVIHCSEKGAGNLRMSASNRAAAHLMFTTVARCSPQLRLDQASREMALAARHPRGNLMRQVKGGGTPEVGGVRLNLSTLLRLAILRLQARGRNWVVSWKALFR